MLKNKKVALFSFFSGAGFLDLGFEDEGFDTVFVNEIHKPFMDAYKHSRVVLGKRMPAFGHSEEDINVFREKGGSSRLRKMIANARNEYDLIGFIGGPPCPDFSVGGKNKGRNGKHGILSEVYADIIINQRPDFFLFENVKGLWRTKVHRQFYDELKKRFQKAGYILSEKLINALEYGAPQDRERIILIGFKESKFGNVDFKWEENARFKLSDIIAKPWPEVELFVAGKVRNRPDGVINELAIQYWFDKNDVANHPNAVHVFKPRAALSRFKSVQEGDVSKKSYKRPHRWRYSPTAAYGNNEVHLHPYYPRRLNVAEVLAIQSLPKKFEFPPTMTLSDMFKAVGNGVPYLAARAIAKTLGNLLELRSETDGAKPRGGYKPASTKQSLPVC